MSVVLEKAREICANIPVHGSFADRAKWLLGEESVDRPFVRFHSNGVAYYAAKLSTFIGMDPGKVEEIHFGSILHDIGKLAVPDEILRYPGKLPPDLMGHMKKHAEAGDLLLGEDAPSVVRNITRYHHERYDGLGYFGLRGEDIPLEARIVQIADVHNALMEKRDYKADLGEEQTLLLMTQNPPERAQFGRFNFDPYLLRRFVTMRLVDIDFNASLSDEGRKALVEYANSHPMSDFDDRLVDGWKIDANGNRCYKYIDEVTGHEKTGEIRNARGALIFVAGPRAEQLSTPNAEQEEDCTSKFTR
jgi:HD-GYP domain